MWKNDHTPGTCYSSLQSAVQETPYLSALCRRTPPPSCRCLCPLPSWRGWNGCTLLQRCRRYKCGTDGSPPPYSCSYFQGRSGKYRKKNQITISSRDLINLPNRMPIVAAAIIIFAVIVVVFVVVFVVVVAAPCSIPCPLAVCCLYSEIRIHAEADFTREWCRTNVGFLLRFADHIVNNLFLDNKHLHLLNMSLQPFAIITSPFF